MDINKKFDKLFEDIVRETINRDWKKSIEATMEVASIIKSHGQTKQAFMLIMENLENEIKLKAGEGILLEWKFAMEHKDHYLSNSVIILPR